MILLEIFVLLQNLWRIHVSDFRRHRIMYERLGYDLRPLRKIYNLRCSRSNINSLYRVPDLHWKIWVCVARLDLAVEESSLDEIPSWHTPEKAIRRRSSIVHGRAVSKNRLKLQYHISKCSSQTRQCSNKQLEKSSYKASIVTQVQFPLPHRVQRMTSNTIILWLWLVNGRICWNLQLGTET